MKLRTKSKVSSKCAFFLETLPYIVLSQVKLVVPDDEVAFVE